jgi:hypothetical protein
MRPAGQFVACAVEDTDAETSQEMKIPQQPVKLLMVDTNHGSLIS